MMRSVWLKDLHEQNTVVEFASLRFERRRDGKILVGPGAMWRDADGQLRFKAYCPADIEDAFGSVAAAPGEIVRDEEYFDLVAVDMYGRAWTSERIRPDVNLSLASRLAIVTGGLRGLAGIAEHKRTVGGSFLVAYSCDVDLPSNRRETFERKLGDTTIEIGSSWSGAEIEIDSLMLRFRKEDGLLWVAGEGHWSEEQRQDVLDGISDSMQFILARRMWPEIVLSAGAGQQRQVIRSIDRKRASAKALRPFQWSADQKDGVAFWDLLRAYYRFSLGNRSSEERELSRWISEFIESSSSPAEIQCLVLGVAVEGLARILASKEAPDDAVKLKVHETAKLIESLDVDAQLKRRIVGFIKTLARLKPRDYLEALAKQGSVPATHIRSWISLRNHSAHAEAFDPSKWDEVLIHLHVVTALFYRLAFLVIDYRGPYTDYGSRLWPTVLSTATSEQVANESVSALGR